MVYRIYNNFQSNLYVAKVELSNLRTHLSALGIVLCHVDDIQL